MIAPTWRAAAGWLLQVLALALAWAWLFRLNADVFSRFAFSARANWIFMPAALRIVYPLVFRSAGVAGLALGGWLIMQQGPPGDPVQQVVIALISAAAPVIGIKLCQAAIALEPDLAGLRPAHLLALAVACAASNSLLLNAYLIAAGAVPRPLGQIVTVFVGDIAGAALVLYLLSVLLALVLPRRPA